MEKVWATRLRSFLGKKTWVFFLISASDFDEFEYTTSSWVPSGIILTISHSLFSGLKFQEKLVGIDPTEIWDLV
jgi:hypothetical protein